MGGMAVLAWSHVFAALGELPSSMFVTLLALALCGPLQCTACPSSHTTVWRSKWVEAPNPQLSPHFAKSSEMYFHIEWFAVWWYHILHEKKGASVQATKKE